MASSSAADEWRAQKVELQQQRAVIEQLHAQMTVAWKENARLMDAARAKGRERASAGSHMQLALAHGSRAVGKLFYSSGSLPSAKRGGEAAATATTLDAAKVRAAGQQKLTRKSVNRRLGTSHQKRPTSDAQKQFAAMYVHEDKWMHDDSGVWIPKMPAKQRWDLVILILILYSCIMVPYRIGMTADAEGAMWVFEVYVTLMFLTDLTFNFNTAYLEGPNFVIDRGMIATNYLKSWFVIDALSSFPVELFDLYAQMTAAPGEEADSGGMKALRALRMFRLLRMLRLLKMQKYIDELEDRFQANMQILQIVKMILGLLYLMHLLGCFWFSVGVMSGAHLGTTWLESYDDGSGVGQSHSVQYLYSVYWALTTLTTVGYGDIVPTNDIERLYALFALLIGALVFGGMLSSLGALLSTVDRNAVELDARLGEFKAFTRWHKMPPELAARVRKYGETLYQRRSAMDEEAIINGLAPSLKTEVVRHLLRKTVARIPMFSEEYCEYASGAFQLELHPFLKPVVYENGETVIGKHAHGDGLYFLDKGTIAAHSALDGRTLFLVSDTGSCFGEHVLRDAPATLTYVANTKCDFFVLSKRHLAKILDKFPSARNEMAEFVFEDVLRHNMLRYWSLRMLISETRERDERVATALQLQVAWIRYKIITLQKRHAQGGLVALLPGVFDSSEGDSARGAGSATVRAGGSISADSDRSARRTSLVAVHGQLSALEAEQSKLASREAAVDSKIRMISSATQRLQQSRGRSSPLSA